MDLTPARALSAGLEPVAGQVYFSIDCFDRYAALGFDEDRIEMGGATVQVGASYFASRGSVMGQVAGQVVASAFAVFNPAVVAPAVDFAWTVTDASTICAARDDGAMAHLRGMLGDAPDGLDRATELLRVAGDGLRPEGKPLYAGLRSLDEPDDPIGAMWRLADRLREYRGDAHTAAWTSAGFDATEIGLLSELYWGLPMRSYSRSRAWSPDDFDAAEERLRSRGLLDGDGLSVAGRDAREAVEVVTDEMCAPIVDALGDDFDELVGVLDRWAAAVRAANGYPALGPQDLAAAAGG